MTPERWQRAKELFHAALERAPEDRASFLDEACPADAEMRGEVWSLVSAHEQSADSFELPADRLAASLLENARDELRAGHVLGHYQILGTLGAGGMGKVYLAKDTRLGRKVALKLLPSNLAGDPGRVRRFEQEARAASALNHPNILTIHEIGSSNGVNFIATEFVEGETLSARISGRPLPAHEVARVGSQIADALAEAHAAGIVHRDIKPSNLVINSRGQVKVLDFGIAKVTRSDADGASDFVTQMRTGAGALLGTAQYMSPEQALGEEVDHRADIFSLGVVLYEMATGVLPFKGNTLAAIFDAILHREPASPLSLNTDLPPELAQIICRALEKDRGRRYQSAAELRDDLDGLLLITNETRGQVTSGARRPQARRSAAVTPTFPWWKRKAAVLALCALVGLSGLVTASLYLARRLAEKSGVTESPAPATQPPKVVPLTSFSGDEYEPAFSPDGTRVAFVRHGDDPGVYVMLLGAGEPLRVSNARPGNYANPTWSPDGRFVAFLMHDGAHGNVYVVPALGGPERKLHALEEFGYGLARPGLSWSPDGKYLAFPFSDRAGANYRIMLLSPETLEERQLTLPEAPNSDDGWPSFSPDGQWVAFARQVGEGADVYVVPISGGEARRLTSDGRMVYGLTWTPDGREIIYAAQSGRLYGPIFSNGGLWRVAFTGGAPEQLRFGTENVSSPATTRHGPRLAYEQSAMDVNIWRFDARGHTSQPTRLIASTRSEASPQFSPDGNRIAFESDRSGDMEIWVCDADGSNALQLTHFKGPHAGAPRWSPDGQWIAFDSTAGGGQADIYVINSAGGAPRQVTTARTNEVVPSWSRDGRWIYFASDRNGSMQIWKVPSDGGEWTQVTQGEALLAFESPDASEVFFYRAGDDAGIWRIPVGGGEETPLPGAARPLMFGHWSVTEKGIYYLNTEAKPRPAIEFFDFATRRTTRIATPEKNALPWVLGLAASPDGRYVLFAQPDHQSSDIMMVENFR